MSAWIRRRARKAHRCVFCGVTIEPGQNYNSVRLTPWDRSDNDGFFTWKAHEYCKEAWEDVVAQDYDYGWMEGEYYEFREIVEQALPGQEYPWLGK